MYKIINISEKNNHKIYNIFGIKLKFKKDLIYKIVYFFNPKKRYEVKEGTEFVVKGIDYDIMGKYAKKIQLLRPKMQEKVYEMFKYTKQKGWTLVIDAGWRSPETQKHLYKEWKAGRFECPLVAKPGTSKHEYGCAIDITLPGRDNSSYSELGQFGKSIGLSWGGDWKKNTERWHFELDPKKTPRGYRNKNK